MKTTIRRLIKSRLPREIKATLRNYKILSAEFGQFKTMRKRVCVDASDVPIPWYSYPAVEYIKQLEFSTKSIFEYGSGYSTRFWADRCRKLISVEDNIEWYGKLMSQLPDNVEYRFLEGRNEYIHAINDYSDPFDVIIIDGSYRFECAVQSLRQLSEYGFIILDNSDWKEKTSELLRKSDLLLRQYKRRHQAA